MSFKTPWILQCKFCGNPVFMLCVLIYLWQQWYKGEDVRIKYMGQHCIPSSISHRPSSTNTPSKQNCCNFNLRRKIVKSKHFAYCKSSLHNMTVLCFFLCKLKKIWVQLHRMHSYVSVICSLTVRRHYQCVLNSNGKALFFFQHDLHLDEGFIIHHWSHQWWI